jgi:threonine/homoserine/homoserine lactone efflux protein
VNPNLLLAFWALAFALIVVPGPDWAFILATSARSRGVLPAVAGLMIGYGLLTAIVAAGLGAVVARSSGVLTGLTAVGAAYLTYLGVSLLGRPSTLHEAAPAAPAATASPMLRGVGVSGLNPKGLLVFLAMLPQFTDANGDWPLRVQLAALGLIFTASCGGFYAVLGLSARAVLATKPAATRLISRISGTAMIIVGLLLIVERIRQIAG